MEKDGKKDDKRERLKTRLDWYRRADMRLRVLCAKKKRLEQEKMTPISGIKYSSMPKATYNTMDQAADIPLRIAEVEEDIRQQAAKKAAAREHVAAVLGQLPEDSAGRQIAELRHLDLMMWEDIQRITCRSRSNCNLHYQKALDALLEMEEEKEAD